MEPPTSGGLAPAKAEAASVQQEIRKLEAGFDTELCADARAGCALTRRHGKLADSVWLNTLRALSAHPTPLVNEALRTFAARYADGEKDERYLLGIVRGLAKGKRGGPRGFSGGMLPESSEFGEAPAEEDLGTLFGGASA